MYCSQCGSENTSQARFCASCGTRLDQGVPAQSTAPEPQQAAERQYAGFWIRFGAWIIDTIVVFVSMILVSTVTSRISFGLPFDFVVLGFFSGFLLPWAYYVILTGLRGQTLGKMAVGISVIGPDGNPPGIAIAALREIVGKLASALVLALGYFWIGWDRQKMGWHDYIAYTHVIRVHQ